jgi:hypothetical protein
MDVITSAWLVFVALLLGAGALLVLPTVLMLFLAGISSHPLGVGADAWAFTVFGALAAERVPRYCPRAEEHFWTLREIASQIGWVPVLRLLRYGRHGLLLRSDVASKRIATFIAYALRARGYETGRGSAHP